MEAVEIVFCDLVQRIRLWLPRKAESHGLPRDFWMPDQSCRVCYECDTPFTLFNRRHHCRICGRVFCGKCTQNTLPVRDGQSGEGDRVRACNFCFKLKQEEHKRNIDQTVAKPSTPALTPSSSSFSLSSSGTSTTSVSSTSTSSSSGNSGQASVAYGFKQSTTERIGPIAEKKQRRPMRSGRKSHRSRSPKARELSPNPYDFCSNRSDDDETDDPKDRLYDTKRSYDMQSQEEEDEEEENSCVEMELANAAANHSPKVYIRDTANHISKVMSTDDEEGCLKLDSTLPVERSLSKRSLMSSDDYDGPEESVDESNFYTPSLIQEPTPLPGEELVDVENDPHIWVPPPPEDEDDEMAITIVDDDDEDDNGSGWGSLSSNEYRIREKATASQEQRRAMRAVVDGHFRALVSQLLDGEGLDVDEAEKDSWLEIVTVLAAQAASLLKPDTSKDGGMDPGGYVKVKCIAAGQRRESCVVKGVVCTKNVSHRRMTSWYKNPRLLLLGGALEYQRVSNQLSSLDTLIQQETVHLSMTASRIEAHHPNVVLVEKNVSRQAQERLLSKDISLVLNVKRPLLERIARCTGAEVVPSPDQISKARLGHCDMFRLEKFVEELGSAGHSGKKLTKTLMCFEGCPRPLGCTILLKGASGDELKKVKRVVQFAVFAAYQLALETSFLVDEGATVPELSFRSPISVALPDKPLVDRTITTVPGFLLPGPGHITPTKGSHLQQNHISNSYSDFAPTTINNPSWSDVHIKLPRSAIAAPWSVTSSSFSSRNNSPSGSPRANCAQEPSTNMYAALQASNDLNLMLPASDLQVKTSGRAYVSLSSGPHSSAHNMGIRFQSLASMDGLVLKSSETLSSLPNLTDVERSCATKGMVKVDSDAQLTVSTEGDREAIHEEFPPSPSDHQSILVSFSSTCLRKRTVCERGHLFRIKYYGSFDKPLGKFLKDNVFDLSSVCGFCEETRDAHIHCYMHRQGSLIISVRHQSEVLSGERDGKIWMWHRCLKCPRVNNVPPATHRVLMSDAAWGLSFGKFLELSFSNHAAASRVAACGHSLHRDCLRFYGFGSMVACFRYAPINVHSVYLPPSKLEFNHPELDDWLQNESAEVIDQGKLLFAMSFNTLREIEEKVASSAIAKAPEARRRIAEYESSLLSDQKAFLETLQKAAPMRREPGGLYADVLELNSLRRNLAALWLVWNQRFQVLRASLKLQKSVPLSRSANLDDPSLLRGMKDTDFVIKGSRPFEETEMSKDSQGYSTDVEERSGADANEINHGIGSSPQKGHIGSGDLDAGNGTASDLQHNKVEADMKPCDGAASDLMHNKNEIKDMLDCDGDSSDSLHKKSEGDMQPCDLFCFTKPQDLDKSAPKVPETEAPNFTPKEAGNSNDILVNGAENMNKQDAMTLLEADSSSKMSLPHDDGTDGKSSSQMSLLDEDDILVRRTLSEGQFPVLPDLSDTFDAAWTGKGHTIEAHKVSISSTGQEIASQGSGGILSGPGDEPTNSIVDTSIEPAAKSTPNASVSCLSSEVGGSKSSLDSPGKSERADDSAHVATPFPSLHKLYSKSSQLSFNGSLSLDSQSPYSSNASIPLEGRNFLPLGIHDTVIPVYDDEPTSIIAYAITSHQYQAHLSDGPYESERLRDMDKEYEGRREIRERDLEFLAAESVSFHPLQVVEGPMDQSEVTPSDRLGNHVDESSNMGLTRENSNLYSKATHVKVSFMDNELQGKVKYMVTCYYAKQFDNLRRTCCADPMDFIRSLCRCKKWGAQGGKSNVFFAKTKDDRFVIKQVTKTELESFIKFAPEYFKYLSESLKSGSPTCLAKILGIFQVTIKHGKGGKEVRMDLMAMENLLYGRHVTRLYDLKGSLRSRYNADTTGKNKVLLDQNLLESMSTNPIYIGNKAKRVLERAVWNDTSFLASMDVMDYSLLVGVDEERKELVLGIIDFMRKYTWDKHLETWVKASGILGGPKNAAPTVISPKQYKKRFRKAMKNYFLMVPEQWSPAPEALIGVPHVDSVESFQQPTT